MSAEPLASYAVAPAASRGRQHAESFPPGAEAFAIDRHRVLHCAAFRRLLHKTQLFVTSQDDHFRTRLTHTLEVVDLARQLAAGLRANATLAEVIALAHDLGHPPFGHAGEQTLAACMHDHGGFEHNVHALRVVEFLEHPYPAFRGLNLSYEVREGLAKHETSYDRPGWHELADGSRPTIEAQIASIADRIAYDCHDLEDAITAELVTAADLHAIPLWREVAEPLFTQYPSRPLFALRRPILDTVTGMLIGDVLYETRTRMAQAGVHTADDVRRCDDELVAFTTSMDQRVETLERFLHDRVYRHHRLIRMDNKARRFINQLFAAYVDEPGLLPPRFANRVQDQGLHRTVCDYIAGMTDRFCQDEYQRLFTPFERV